MLEGEGKGAVTPMDVDDLLMGFLYAWIKDDAPEGKTAIRRYCEYIRFRGYPDFAFVVVESFKHMDMGRAETWIRQTHAQYSQDDWAMLAHIFGVEVCPPWARNRRV